MIPCHLQIDPTLLIPFGYPEFAFLNLDYTPGIEKWKMQWNSHSVGPTHRDPIDCSLPGSSVYGILQVRILEWVAIPFSRGCSQPRDWTQVSCTAGRFFTIWATRAVPWHKEYTTIQFHVPRNTKLNKSPHLLAYQNGS